MNYCHKHGYGVNGDCDESEEERQEINKFNQLGFETCFTETWPFNATQSTLTVILITLKGDSH